MEKVEIKRADLIEVLRKNRETHRATFDKAIEGFKHKAVELLEERLKAAKAGIKDSLFVALEMPRDQTKDYDRQIRMFEMDVRETLSLTEKEFACYVMDDWSWKDQFTRSTAMYLNE